jgi:hypothetical protein
MSLRSNPRWILACTAILLRYGRQLAAQAGLAANLINSKGRKDR